VTRRLVSSLFFVSIGATVPAALIGIFGGPKTLMLVFVVVAAGAPALAAGNTVVLKPASDTPYCAALLVEFG